MTYARCCDCKAEGELNATTRITDMSGDKCRQCLHCESLNVDVLSEEGLAYEKKGEAQP
jgi:hypothetical protein